MRRKDGRGVDPTRGLAALWGPRCWSGALPKRLCMCHPPGRGLDLRHPGRPKWSQSAGVGHDRRLVIHRFSHTDLAALVGPQATGGHYQPSPRTSPTRTWHARASAPCAVVWHTGVTPEESQRRCRPSGLARDSEVLCRARLLEARPRGPRLLHGWYSRSAALRREGARAHHRSCPGPWAL